MKIIASMIFLLFVIDALALTEKAFIDKADCISTTIGQNHSTIWK
jgi:hypothetical protein